MGLRLLATHQREEGEEFVRKFVLERSPSHMYRVLVACVKIKCG
jgi:hypothetical protein